MSTVAFEIVVTPDEKFILRWGKASQAGPFEDLQEAEAAMRRVIENKVYRYDKAGKLIT